MRLTTSLDVHANDEIRSARVCKRIKCRRERTATDRDTIYLLRRRIMKLNHSKNRSIKAIAASLMAAFAAFGASNAGHRARPGQAQARRTSLRRRLFAAAASGRHGDGLLRRAPAAGHPGQRGAHLLRGRALHGPRGIRSHAPGQPGNDLAAGRQGGAGRALDDDDGRAGQHDHGGRGRFVREDQDLPDDGRAARQQAGDQGVRHRPHEFRHGRRRQEALSVAGRLFRPQGAQHGPGRERLALRLEGQPRGHGLRRSADGARIRASSTA